MTRSLPPFSKHFDARATTPPALADASRWAAHAAASGASGSSAKTPVSAMAPSATCVSRVIPGTTAGTATGAGTGTGGAAFSFYFSGEERRVGFDAASKSL